MDQLLKKCATVVMIVAIVLLQMLHLILVGLMVKQVVHCLDQSLRLVLRILVQDVLKLQILLINAFKSSIIKFYVFLHFLIFRLQMRY
jgi:hypothetical protein